MPSNCRTITGLTRSCETPPTVLDPLIHRTTPATNADDPSVATKESSPRSATRAPLARPTAAPLRTPARIAQPVAQPWSTLSRATTIAESETTEPTERSDAPAVSGISRPSVTTTSTVCEPKIVWKFAAVRKVLDSIDPKRITTAPHATGSAHRRPIAAGSRRTGRPGASITRRRHRVRLRDPLLRDLLAGELVHDPPTGEDEDAVADRLELLVVRARAENGRPVLHRSPDQREDLLTCSDVDAVRRLVEQEQGRP